MQSMKFRLSSDQLSALMFIGLGLFAIIHSLDYPLGTASRMGAGYFPKIIGGGLLCVGITLGVKTLRDAGEALELPPLRPLFFVLLGTVSFGVLIEGAGVIVASTVLVCFARCASADFRLKEVLAISAVIAAAVILIFVYVLGIRIPVLPKW